MQALRQPENHDGAGARRLPVMRSITVNGTLALEGHNDTQIFFTRLFAALLP